jgi:hypothetical protein
VSNTTGNNNTGFGDASCEALPGGADLREAMRTALEQCAAEGWQAESDGAYGFAFVARGSERCLVNLTPAEPSIGVGAGHGVLAGRGVVYPPLAQSVTRGGHTR